MSDCLKLMLVAAVFVTSLGGCGGGDRSSAYSNASEQEIADFKAQYEKDMARHEDAEKAASK